MNEMDICPYSDNCDECPYPDCDKQLIMRFERALWVAMNLLVARTSVVKMSLEIGVCGRTLKRWRADAVKFGLL